MGYYAQERSQRGWEECIFAERPLASDDYPFFKLLVMTGTGEKYLNALSVYLRERIVPAEGITQFFEASLAKEAVTHDSNYLIIGKQYEQRKVFLQKLNAYESWRGEYHGKRVITVANDINTTIDRIPLTKTKIQKKENLTTNQYALLIRSSLKYLLARSNNLLPSDAPSWEKFTSDFDLLRKFDENASKLFSPDHKYILPVDFQSIDAFEILKIDAPSWRNAKVEQVGPAIVVLNKSFASIELETNHEGKMPKLDDAIEHYRQVTTGLYSNKYQLDRCPLGIYWATLFNSMAVKGVDVHMSVVGQKDPAINLRERYLKMRNFADYSNRVRHSEVNRDYESPMEQLELIQNGYYGESFRLAMKQYKVLVAKDNTKILCIQCRPGQEPILDWQNRPREFKN